MVAGTSDPFAALLRMQRELERNVASGWLGDTTAAAGAFPPINIFRQDHDLVAIIELPGLDKESIDVQAKEDTIRIRGTKDVNYGEDVSLHRRERITGSFDRTITVPIRMEADRIKAEYRDGILALFIPRAESDKPRTIQITA